MCAGWSAMRWRISMSLSGKPWRRKCRQSVLINVTLIRGLLRYVHRLERDAVTGRCRLIASMRS
jgi:hypothetical protein